MKKVFLSGLVILAVVVGCLGYTSVSQAAEIDGIMVTQFSFASDSEHQRPTFTGSREMIYAKAEVNLMLDQNQDTYGGSATFLALLEMKAEIREHRLYNIDNQWLHVWKVYAEFGFTHLNPALNAPILSVKCKEALLTSWSPRVDQLGETMTLQDCESTDPSLTMISEKLLRGIGIPQETLEKGENFAFTFTKIQPTSLVSTPFVRLDRSGYFLDEWKSEGSFSASAYGWYELPVIKLEVQK